MKLNDQNRRINEWDRDMIDSWVLSEKSKSDVGRRLTGDPKRWCGDFNWGPSVMDIWGIVMATVPVSTGLLVSHGLISQRCLRSNSPTDHPWLAYLNSELGFVPPPADMLTATKSPCFISPIAAQSSRYPDCHIPEYEKIWLKMSIC
jgi:hypothetical protein